MNDVDNDYENVSLTLFWPPTLSFSDNGFEEDVAWDSYGVKVPVSIILVVCLMVSVIGNACTCAVIARDRSMRTPTNCYLFNLAVTDLTTAMFIPIEIYLVWAPDSYPFGAIGCMIHIIFWDWLSNCSLLTIAAFTVERYLAVSRPFLRHKLILKSRVYKIVALNWIISGCFGIPDFFLIGVLKRKEQTYCYFKMPGEMKILIATEMFVFFVVPMTIIIVLYILIALKIKSIRMLQKNSPVNGKQYRDKTIKMLAAVAATFFFCWFPFFLLRLIAVAPPTYWTDYYTVRQVFRYICIVNAYIYTAVNPILYSLMSQKFSRAFKDSVLDWARDHRMHHKYSETDADPHNATRGFFFSHVGWLLVRKHPQIKAKGHTIDMSDLCADPVLRFQKKYYLTLMPLFCFILPTYIPTLWGESIWNAYWVCAIFRYCYVLNVTWLVNSAAHKWGDRPYDKNINPVETKPVSLVVFGEGFHNYHHTFPWDYKTAELGGYSLNLSKLFIDTMSKIGWAYDLKSVSKDIVEKRVKRTGDGSHAVWGWDDQDVPAEQKQAATIVNPDKTE